MWSILNTLLLRYFKNRDEKKQFELEFEEIRNSIQLNRTTNDYFEKLIRLKRFFEKHPELLDKEPNGIFWDKWLNIMMMEHAQGSVGYWYKDNIIEMLNDLEKTTL